MSVYDDNYKCIEFYCPPFEVEENEEVESYVFENEDGIVATLVSDDYEYRLCSLVRNAELSENLLKSMEPLDDYGIYVVYGMGNLDFIRALIKKKKNTAYVVVIEPNKGIFTKMMHSVPMEDILSEKYVFFFCESINWNMHEDYFPYITDESRLNHIIFIEQMNYKNVYGEDLKMVRRRYEKQVDYRQMSINTNIHKRGRFAKCSIGNMRHYIYESDADLLIEKIKETESNQCPAILVASGPSLKSCVEQLKKANGKAFILAIDNSIQYCFDNGIKPNLGILIDTDKGMNNLRGEDVLNLPMILSDYATVDFSNIHKARKFYEVTYSRIIYQHVFDRVSSRTVSEGGTTVANPAMEFLIDCGFENIILLGNDLAYPNGEVHIHKNMYGTDDFILKNACYEVDANNGTKVSTTPDMDCARATMEDAIKSKREAREKEGKSLTIINCSEGGAKIEGTEYMPASEAIDKYCKKEMNFDEVLSEAPRNYGDTEAIAEAKKKINRLVDLSDQMKELVVQLNDEYKKLLEDYCAENVTEEELANRLRFMQKKLGKMEDNPLIPWTISYASYDETSRMDVYDTEKTEKEIIEFGVRLTGVYIEAIDEMQEEISRVLLEE